MSTLLSFEPLPLLLQPQTVTGGRPKGPAQFRLRIPAQETPKEKGACYSPLNDQRVCSSAYAVNCDGETRVDGLLNDVPHGPDPGLGPFGCDPDFGHEVGRRVWLTSDEKNREAIGTCWVRVYQYPTAMLARPHDINAETPRHICLL